MWGKGAPESWGAELGIQMWGALAECLGSLGLDWSLGAGQIETEGKG